MGNGTSTYSKMLIVSRLGSYGSMAESVLVAKLLVLIVSSVQDKRTLFPPVKSRKENFILPKKCTRRTCADMVPNVAEERHGQKSPFLFLPCLF